MVGTIYKATKTRFNRPGWSVTFRHPQRTDTRGKPGLKVRRGLGTADTGEADTLVEQLNELLNDPAWGSVDRRQEAEMKFAGVVVSAFFDGMETVKINSADLREGRIPLPSQEDGYARVMLVGTTGAGKTTLLRHIIGSDHDRDRFPSTSTARTTTADIEIVLAEDVFFGAVITFMPEDEVRTHVDECLEEACLAAIEGQPEIKIVGALLSHREQRFRLSYLLGSWQLDEPSSDKDFSFDDEEIEEDFLNEDEAVTTDERTRNKSHLDQYLERVRSIANSVEKKIGAQLGALNEMALNDRETWLELFTEHLFEDEEFTRLSLDIMEEIECRFEVVKEGDFEHSPTGWPTLWSYENKDYDTFLQQVRWFSSNHHRQFGRLLTPLVDGMRVKGPFYSSDDQLRVVSKLVVLDGQGLGHTARSATSVSTRVTRRFADVDMILLVDNAEQPMQAAPIELLRSVGSSGHADKLAVAFTHFDLVKGANLGDFQQKREHVLNSVRDAVASLRPPLSGPVAADLEHQIERNAVFLGGLDRAITEIPCGFRSQLGDLMSLMQQAAVPSELVEIGPIYTTEGLESVFRDAVEGFIEPWRGRLGLQYHDSIEKEHWTRVKALSRRFGNAWSNEYDDLRPVADLVARLQENISLWLDNPAGWTREPQGEEERDGALDAVRKGVFTALHDLAEDRLSDEHRSDWQTAYGHVGRGSSFRRADEIERIYKEAAPAISSAMSGTTREFLHGLYEIVREAVEEVSGAVRVGYRLAYLPPAKSENPEDQSSD